MHRERSDFAFVGASMVRDQPLARYWESWTRA